MALFESVIDIIGGTPLVRLASTTGGAGAPVYVKLESHNPGGSAKDRAALWMIRAAERDGLLSAGGTVVETTSGNTGIGVALVAARLGYRAVIFISSSVAAEKIRLLRAYGAEVHTVDGYLPKTHPDSPFGSAKRFVDETPGAWRAGQYDNPANPQAHFDSTGPEIWSDTDGRITHLVSSVGTGGTITGIAEYLGEASGGRVRIVGAEPEYSSYGGGDGSPKSIEGAGHAAHPEVGEDVWPQSFHPAAVDDYVLVSDRDSIEAARDVARCDGLLLGGSGGTAVAAGRRLASTLGPDDLVVVVAPDSGRNYLSTYFDDDWVVDNGFAAEPVGAGGSRVRDVTRGAERPLHTVGKNLTVAEAVDAIAAAGWGDDETVFVTFVREPALTALPASEALGVVTVRQLATAANDGLVVDAAETALPTIGIDRAAATAVRLLDAKRPGWARAAVLSDGRIVGTVDRDALAGAAS